MEEKKEMTLGELIYSEQFQTRLEKRIKEWFKAYDKAVMDKGGNVKRNPTMRLREMGAEKPEKMTELYVGIIDHKSDLSSEMRERVKAICEPVLNACLVEYMKKLKAEEKAEAEKKEAQDGGEKQD